MRELRACSPKFVVDARSSVWLAKLGEVAKVDLVWSTRIGEVVGIAVDERPGEVRTTAVRRRGPTSCPVRKCLPRKSSGSAGRTKRNFKVKTRLAKAALKYGA